MNDDTRTILEGTKAHILLAEIHPAFHEFVDAGFSVASENFDEKARHLLRLISEFKEARKQYMLRESPYHL